MHLRIAPGHRGRGVAQHSVVICETLPDRTEAWKRLCRRQRRTITVFIEQPYQVSDGAILRYGRSSSLGGCVRFLSVLFAQCSQECRAINIYLMGHANDL